MRTVLPPLRRAAAGPVGARELPDPRGSGGRVDGHAADHVRAARRLKDPVLVLQPPEDSPSSPMVWRTRSDIADYHQPLAPGALFKCAVGFETNKE